MKIINIRKMNSSFSFSEAWLFGSFARGNQNENSDIDIAIVLDDCVAPSFDTEIQLMIIKER